MGDILDGLLNIKLLVYAFFIVSVLVIREVSFQFGRGNGILFAALVYLPMVFLMLKNIRFVRARR